MTTTFKDLPDKLSFPAEEEKTAQFWKDINAFHTSLKLSEGKPEYTFYDGPPFATGTPHYGHILAGTIKDTVTRYAHQTGHYVSRRFGWDCHGLPVEYEIDKKLEIKGREDVLKMGVKAYNDECRGIVQRYTGEWETTVTRLGRWIDFKNDYKTMDPSFMESVWWVFSQMFEKGLVYRGYKVMPYSMACGTPLSNFEAGLNYKDVSDPAVVVTFPLESDPNVNLVAWTTTPWTLPSNLALCVNPAFDYVKIKDKGRDKVFIILEKRLSQLFPEVAKADCTPERKTELYEILEVMKGEKLIGMKYTPIFPYFSTLSTAFRVVGDGYVTEEGGTGIVHQAPAFGEDDYRVCLANNIVPKGDGLPCPIDDNGRFTNEVPEFYGMNVKDADQDICKHLKINNRLVVKESYKHSYPFCWRSETPLIYKCIPSWFVSVETIKDRLCANNLQTYWTPSFVKEKRFHNWLSEARDWAISRNRFWGTPIPLWVSDDLEEVVCVSSIEELEQLSGVKATDLHKENIDTIEIPSKKGKGMLKRVDEVFDCWFESGSMPYAQLHYPFENKDRFESGYPADFIAEGIDQCRGWFYTLMIISTCLFDKPAFKNVIVNGLVLASDGKKMSKRLKNYPDPMDVINKHGSDALRLYLINSPVVRADTLKFQEAGVSDVVKSVFIPWFNSFRFFAQCVDRLEGETGEKFAPSSEISKSSKDDVDIWILASTFGLVQYVHQEMNGYRLYTVVPRLCDFIDQLTNWYVRLNRDRLKGTLGVEQAKLGLNVLFEVLSTMSVVMAPFTPYFSEYTYQYLRRVCPLYGNTDSSIPMDAIGKADSVHYLMLPVVDESRINERAEARFKTLQVAVSLCRVARERRKMRSNLPLKNVLIVCANESDVEALTYLKSYLSSEINAWNIELSTDTSLCALKAIPDFKTLGARCGKKMKDVSKGINELTQDQVLDFMQSGSISLCGFDFTTDDLVVKRQFSGDAKIYEASVSDDGSLVCAVDTRVDEEMMQELRASTLAATVQKMRKSAGLVVGDVVEIFYEEKGDVLANALYKHAPSTINRIKSFPLPATYIPKYASSVIQETVNDPDLGKSAVTITLTRPNISVDTNVVSSVFGGDAAKIDLATHYLQTMEYARVSRTANVKVTVDGSSVELIKGTHYHLNANEMVKSLRDKPAYLNF